MHAHISCCAHAVKQLDDVPISLLIAAAAAAPFLNDLAVLCEWGKYR